ncbi:MAG: Maf-like protein [Muribaculaceae bacterium]|nr:Maf-like protein [Muribaculaceae bacterium]MDE5595507.1 Maf-like protein [Muribaculaceae bacterium]
MKLLLASNSPRRRELLGLLDVDYEIIAPREVEEVYPAALPAEEVAPYLSSLKASAYAGLPKGDEIIVTADTVVVCEGRILGKPKDREDAIAMLRLLSGKTHKVVTGVTLMSEKQTVTFSETTLVTFDTLSDSMIESYVDRYRPFDKAGAYGIQEWIGCVGISAITGCYYNVMGLPLHTLYTHLSRF